MTLARLTIRARITIGSLLIAILISIAASIVIYAQVARIVHDGQVRVLESMAGPYLASIGAGDVQEFDPPGPGQYIAVVRPDGTVAVDTLPSGLPGSTAELAAGPVGVRTSGADSEYLVKVSAADNAGASWHVITASANDTEVLDQVAIVLIASIAAINLGFGAAAWLIGSATLGPVARLRRSAADLVASPGGELLPVGPAKDEISDLAETLNELIRELRSSAERERQIVSDASHEFRTPLAIIQTRLELAQRQASTLPAMKADVAAAQKTLGRLSSLATSMLELSRIDAQLEPGRATVGELATELADAADRGRQRVGGRDIRIDYTDETIAADASTAGAADAPAAVVAVSDTDFGRVCDNLVNNALAAIGERGAIELHLARDPDGVRLTVTDDGGGMDDAYVPFAFDRFSRENSARTRGGAGLGLSIVAGIAALSGGTVALHNSPGTGLGVEVTFPLATR